jgi:hypothetical protein
MWIREPSPTAKRLLASDRRVSQIHQSTCRCLSKLPVPCSFLCKAACYDSRVAIDAHLHVEILVRLDDIRVSVRLGNILVPIESLALIICGDPGFCDDAFEQGGVFSSCRFLPVISICLSCSSTPPACAPLFFVVPCPTTRGANRKVKSIAQMRVWFFIGGSFS